jgi:RNA polymerase sigma factor (sigma-70 family)
VNSLTDQQLLRDYTERRSEAAFSELVRRHVDFVYSAALRMVRDAHLAEDVTQAVFVALAQSARELADRPVLAGWLHRTAQNLAANTVRSTVRRRAREQEAAAMNELLAAESDATWELIAPHLDAALGELSEPDRDALLLRYFERKSAHEIAQTLGVSDEAAQKRVSRAVERLREFFTKRGVTVGASGLVVVLSANAVQAAPAGLALSISTSAALAGTAVTAVTTSTAAKALAMTTPQKTLVATTLAAAIGVGIYEAHQASRLRDQITTIQQQRTPRPVSSNDAALSALQGKIDRLAAQNAELSNALTRANTDKARLETEREQARHSAALFKELADQASSKDLNPTNEYPTSRHVWAAFGRMGRLMALSKEDDSKLSPEEKSALEAAKAKALEGLPNLVKAARQYDAAEPTGADAQAEDRLDHMACLLYGALNLGEQQFGQVYSLMQKYQQEAKQKGLSQTNSAPETVAAMNQMIEQFKAETQSLLTPDQARILAEVLTHIQLKPGEFGFNFNF